MKRLVFVSLTVLALGMAVVEAQEPRVFRLGGANGPETLPEDPNRPAPKLADGTVDLSGIWSGGGGEEIPRLLKPG